MLWSFCDAIWKDLLYNDIVFQFMQWRIYSWLLKWSRCTIRNIVSVLLFKGFIFAVVCTHQALFFLDSCNKCNNFCWRWIYRITYYNCLSTGENGTFSRVVHCQISVHINIWQTFDYLLALLISPLFSDVRPFFHDPLLFFHDLLCSFVASM